MCLCGTWPAMSTALVTASRCVTMPPCTGRSRSVLQSQLPCHVAAQQRPQALSKQHWAQSTGKPALQVADERDASCFTCAEVHLRDASACLTWTLRLQVTFLYKLAEGACPKSYGPNVAHLAGLPPSLLARASVLSNTLEACASDRSIPLAAALAAQQGTRTGAGARGLDGAESSGIQGLCQSLSGWAEGQGDEQSRMQELKAMQAELVSAK